jgi:glycine oxidase
MRVIVVGAGAIGLMSALRLAERGADVTVLEADAASTHPPHAASRAAAGMLGPLSETLVERVETHPRLLELGLASLDLWRARGAMLALETLPARGALVIGDVEALTLLEKRAEEVGRKALWRGGRLALPEEGAVDAITALLAMERALEDRGGRVRRGVAVERCMPDNVIAGGARIQADAVVIAPGIWGSALAVHFTTLSAMKGQLVELGSSALAPGETVRMPDCYAVGRRRGSVIIGATMEPGLMDLTPDPNVAEALAARARAHLPALAAAPIVGSWAGVRPMSADWAPRIGRAEGLVIAGGHSRNGWLLAPITAEIVCAHVFDEPIESLWTAFAP